MNTLTLEAIKAEQTKLAAMIAALEVQAKAEAYYPITVAFPELKPGERYLGAVISACGTTRQHIILQPIERGIDFVGQVIKPWHCVTRRRTFNDAIRRVRSVPADELFETANSYYGLLRQSTHSHHDRALLSNELRRRGHSIKSDLTKLSGEKQHDQYSNYLRPQQQHLPEPGELPPLHRAALGRVRRRGAQCPARGRRQRLRHVRLGPAEHV